MNRRDFIKSLVGLPVLATSGLYLGTADTVEPEGLIVAQRMPPISGERVLHFSMDSQAYLRWLAAPGDEVLTRPGETLMLEIAHYPERLIEVSINKHFVGGIVQWKPLRGTMQLIPNGR